MIRSNLLPAALADFLDRATSTPNRRNNSAGGLIENINVLRHILPTPNAIRFAVINRHLVTAFDHRAGCTYPLRRILTITVMVTRAGRVKQFAMLRFAYRVIHPAGSRPRQKRLLQLQITPNLPRRQSQGSRNIRVIPTSFTQLMNPNPQPQIAEIKMA
jgi:hypothetical protein